MLYRVTNAEATHLSLALRPHPRGRGRPWEYLSVSATGPKGTFHACTQAFRGEDAEPHHVLDVSPKPFLDAVLCSCCAYLRAAVREVWVTSVDPQTARLLSREVTAHFKAVIAALPVLETAVVVVGPGVVCAGDELHLEVDLGVLPSAHDPGLESPNLKTLRIVHKNFGASCNTGEELGQKMRLTKLLDQIGTGAYGYFENVLLQVTQPLEMDEEDVAQLEACFRRVVFERVDNVHTAMPLPEYCKEPYAGGGSGQWIGSLW